MFDLITITYYLGGTFCSGTGCVFPLCFHFFSSKHAKYGCITGLVGYVYRMIVRYSVCNGQVQREKKLMSSTQAITATLSLFFFVSILILLLC